MCLFTLLHEKQDQIHRTTATLSRAKTNSSPPHNKNPKPHNQKASNRTACPLYHPAKGEPYAYYITTLAELGMKNGIHLPLSLGDTLISDISHFERLGKGRKRCLWSVSHKKLSAHSLRWLNCQDTLIWGQWAPGQTHRVNHSKLTYQVFGFCVHILGRWTQKSVKIISQYASFCTPQRYKKVEADINPRSVLEVTGLPSPYGPSDLRKTEHFLRICDPHQ